jgi:hypothetical protein
MTGPFRGSVAVQKTSKSHKNCDGTAILRGPEQEHVFVSISCGPESDQAREI